MQIDEPIAVVPYAPAWPDLYALERDRLVKVLGAKAAGIEHFGSTAVPGLAGKPVIDLLVGVEDFEKAGECAAAIEALGYDNFGQAFIAERHYLRRRTGTNFNVAVTQWRGPFWRDQIVIRDYLRAHPQDAEHYALHKRRVVADGAVMFSSYSIAKSDFLESLRLRANVWRAANDQDHELP